MITNERFEISYKELGISLDAVRSNWSELVHLINCDDKIPAKCIVWTVDDIQRCVEQEYDLFLTKNQAAQILDRLIKHHDASTGINYNCIDYWYKELFAIPKPQKTITLVCGCNHVYDFKYIEEKPGEVPEEITDFTTDDCPNCQGE